MQNSLNLAARHLDLLLALLHQYVPQSEVWAFGSRVTGGSHECSDLDLVLRNTADLKLATEGWSELKEALEQSSLPILVDVHDWAYLPASFHHEIARCYVVLKTAEKG